MNKKFIKERISKKSNKNFKNKYLKILISKISLISFKKITIIRSFIVISIISILAIVFIGIASFYTINQTHNNLNLMYKNSLQKDILLSSININLNDLRNSAEKQIEYPSNTYKNIMNKEIEEISTELVQFKTLDFNDNTAKIDAMIEELFGNLKKTCDSIAKIENNESLISAKSLYKLNFNQGADNLNSAISAAVNMNKADAEELFNQTDKAYKNGVIIFIVVFIISIILILLVVAVVVKLLMKSISNFTNILDTLALGDFTVDIQTDEKSEIGIMKKGLATTISSISNILKLIKEGSLLTLEKSQSLASVSKEMDCTMQEVAVAIHGIAEGASLQSNDLMVINNSFSKLGDEIGSIAISIKIVDENTKSVNTKAQSSNIQLSALIETINAISNSFDNTSGKIQGLGIKISEIDKIADVLKSIADQTNLLSLNASIEAARAGEAGKGFAVVANEIKKLAEQSKNSSNDINRLIQDISKETGSVVSTTNGVNEDLKNQVTVIENSVQDFKKIIEDINDILPQIEEINNTVEKIDNEKNQIIQTIQSTASIGEENSASSEEIAASTQEVTVSAESLSNTAQLLESNSNNLIKHVNNFKLAEDI